MRIVNIKYSYFVSSENSLRMYKLRVLLYQCASVYPRYGKYWCFENKHDLHPVAFATEAYYKLATIHPFVDGNGRAARLLMNLLLMIHGYPPAIIRKRDKLAHISALEKAQLGDSKLDYERIICKAVDRSLNLYLKAVHGGSAKGEIDDPMKIGELAKATSKIVSTIRF